MKLTERAAYLKGLAEGFDLDTTKPKNKLINDMIILLGEMAEKIEELESETSTLNDYCDELDHDLGDLESEVYEIEDECDCDDDEDDDDDECDCCHHDDDDDDEDDDDEVFYEVECPKCGEKVYFDETIDPSEITCPNCGETFDCVCEDDECDCGCCHGDDKDDDEDDDEEECECCKHEDKEDK